MLLKEMTFRGFRLVKAIEDTLVFPRAPAAVVARSCCCAAEAEEKTEI